MNNRLFVMKLIKFYLLIFMSVSHTYATDAYRDLQKDFTALDNSRKSNIFRLESIENQLINDNTAISLLFMFFDDKNHPYLQ